MPNPRCSSSSHLSKQLITETVRSVLSELEKNHALPQSLLNTQETAEYLNSSISFLTDLRTKDAGPPYLRIQSAIRYRRSDIEAWLLAHQVKPANSS